MQNFEPHEVKLANEIADTLKDRNSLALFLTYAHKYQEKFLKEVLAQVMSIDESKIKRSRGALFTFLVNQHGAHGHSRS
jgi:hypothetical protein